MRTHTEAARLVAEAAKLQAECAAAVASRPMVWECAAAVVSRPMVWSLLIFVRVEKRHISG